MHRDTMILKAGCRPSAEAGPFLLGPQFSSTFTSPGDPAQHRLTYGRFHNPTWTAWEEALGVLEGGQAIAYASGMAAVAAVFGVCLKPGEAVVLPSDSYYTTRGLAAGWLKSIGIDVRLAPTRDNAQAGALEGARLLWIETPTNPQLDVCDIGALVQAARNHRVLVAVDNTTATAYLQRPLELGVDFAVASDTKALTGHSDVVLGHVATTERGASHCSARMAHSARSNPWAHGSLAGAPFARDTASAPWPPVCLRPGTCRLSGHAARCRSRVLSRSTWPSRSCHCKASDARVRHGRELRPRHARAGRDVPSLADAGARSDQLRGSPFDGRAAGAMGRRCHQRRVRSVQRGLRVSRRHPD